MWKIVFLIVLFTYSQALQVYIEPTEGARCPKSTLACYNINTFAGQEWHRFSTHSSVYFLEGTHLTNHNLHFNGLNNVVFEGHCSMKQGFDETNCQSKVIIKCADDTEIRLISPSSI